MNFNNLLWEQDGKVAIVSFNRPQAMNALNLETLEELERVIWKVANDNSIGVLILTGSGGKAFVGGADIAELRALESSIEGVALCRRAQGIAAGLEEMGKPVIAAINGFALGGGLELALACDIRLAADTARVGLPEISLGIIPGNGGTQRLARLVGKGLAKYLIFTGSHLTAQEALELGIVEKVYPAGELLGKAKELAAKLAKCAPVALAMAKRAINIGLDTDLATACAMEAYLFGIAAGTEDAKEGTGAFLDKRQPQFIGR
ncbi:enoyl-CoA hydratase/isomerase family protein [Desulfosporosinus youngiae]|uniref:short-chain-enoyl-CoA hydratase n=1 Tax=Desulfosporosinus youngiae DSM 17734 TaxID=768710 RepID=H5Y3B2_9FIRM|nr:enoyl-CoA hydratase-related protein [Desulfosporosinus youngiae]EHQ88881.1 enoyl-CoA hydratase/carnithine racemase [Desulfosporosinus youngiae DSM 17734]